MEKKPDIDFPSVAMFLSGMIFGLGIMTLGIDAVHFLALAFWLMVFGVVFGFIGRETLRYELRHWSEYLKRTKD